MMKSLQLVGLALLVGLFWTVTNNDMDNFMLLMLITMFGFAPIYALVINAKFKSFR